MIFTDDFRWYFVLQKIALTKKIQRSKQLLLKIIFTAGTWGSMRVKMFDNYLKTKQIDSTLINDLISFRQAYNYPNAYLLHSSSQTDFKLTSCNYFDYKNDHDEYSDQFIDDYHKNLLFSPSSIDNILGTASVIYWGFQTFNHNYAMNRVKWHLNGRCGSKNLSPYIVAITLKKIIECNDVSEALSKLSALNELGSLSFGSKVISFMYPEKAGVYDKQIHDGLVKTSWAKTAQLIGSIGTVSNKNKITYSNWCAFLSSIAQKINDGISEGKNNWAWTSQSGVSMKWRAVDVERAIFQKFRQSNKQ